MRTTTLSATLARSLFGAAAIAVGIVDIVWGAFDPAHQPIQAWGESIPGRHAFAYIVGCLLVAGGGAVLLDRMVRFGAGLLAIIYTIVAIFWLPRFYTAPLVLGIGAPAYLGVLGGVCQELVVICAALLLRASASPASPRTKRLTTGVRWIFGLSAIDFGLAHLTGIANNLMYVPQWMPFGRTFWVIFTGVAFILAGIAIVSKVADVAAARLLALMWFVLQRRHADTRLDSRTAV